MQLLRLIYPHQCALCDTLVEEDGALCGVCWRDVPFILGLTCDLCGAPLPGEGDGHVIHCDDCMSIARPWVQGRAALVYNGQARKLVLALKHGDRLDLKSPATRWLHRAAQPLLRPSQVIVPVPAHWWRTFRRRYNQAALLAQGLGKATGQPVAVEALVRHRVTEVQDGQIGRGALCQCRRGHPSASASRQGLEGRRCPAGRRCHDLGRDPGRRGRGRHFCGRDMCTGCDSGARREGCLDSGQPPG